MATFSGRAGAPSPSWASWQLEQVPVLVSLQVRQVEQMPGPGRGGATSSGTSRSDWVWIQARSTVGFSDPPGLRAMGLPRQRDGLLGGVDEDRRLVGDEPSGPVLPEQRRGPQQDRAAVPDGLLGLVPTAAAFRAVHDDTCRRETGYDAVAAQERRGGRGRVRSEL